MGQANGYTICIYIACDRLATEQIPANVPMWFHNDMHIHTHTHTIHAHAHRGRRRNERGDDEFKRTWTVPTLH